MNITEEELELIDAYFREELSKESEKEFENKRANNVEFDQKVEDFEHTFLGIESAIVKEKMNDFHDSLITSEETTSKEPGKVRSIRSNFIKFMVAASLITFGLFWYLNDQSGPDKLFEQHFSPDPGLPTTMGNQSNFTFLEGMVDYKLGDYDMAIEKWKILSTESPENDTLNYFLGVAHLAKMDDESAMLYLEKTINDTGSSFRSDAYYYQALALLKAGKTEKAIEFLSNSNHEKAAKLRSELIN